MKKHHKTFFFHLCCTYETSTWQLAIQIFLTHSFQHSAAWFLVYTHNLAYKIVQIVHKWIFTQHLFVYHHVSFFQLQIAAVIRKLCFYRHLWLKHRIAGEFTRLKDTKIISGISTYTSLSKFIITNKGKIRRLFGILIFGHKYVTECSFI